MRNQPFMGEPILSTFFWLTVLFTKNWVFARSQFYPLLEILLKIPFWNDKNRKWIKRSVKKWIKLALPPFIPKLSTNLKRLGALGFCPIQTKSSKKWTSPTSILFEIQRKFCTKFSSQWLNLTNAVNARNLTAATISSSSHGSLQFRIFLY